MLAIWKDDTFTERLCDTGGIKIESYIEKLLDEEKIKEAAITRLKSDGYDNLAGKDFSKMTAKYMMELREKIWSIAGTASRGKEKRSTRFNISE